MRRDHFARPARRLLRTAERVAGVRAKSKSKGESMAVVRAHRHAEGVDLFVVRCPVPQADPVPSHTEKLGTFDLRRALGSGAPGSHKLDDDETTQSEPLTGNLARSDTPLFHIDGQIRLNDRFRSTHGCS